MFFEFFVANIFHFEKNILQKDILFQIPCLQGKIQSKKFAKNCIQYERVFKIFYFHSYNIAQIWLNTVINDCHLSNMTKLERKTLRLPCN